MTAPIRLLVHGASGRMGRELLALLPGAPRFTLVAAVARDPGGVPAGLPAFASADLALVPDFDVAIDFSLAPGFDPLLDRCVRRGAALVSGTTGLSTQQRDAMADAAKAIPLLWASNFSLGVAVLQALVERAAAELADWDIEIVETHHRRKLDAPSGTALSLGEAAARGRGSAGFEWVDRNAQPAARQPGSIGIAAVRGGNVIGEHRVLLFGDSERIELAHRAEERAVFARGALHAAGRLAGRAPGLYSIGDLIAAG